MKLAKLISYCVGGGITLISLATASVSQAVTLTFDELPTQPVDDLSFMGVTFDFKLGGVDSINAVYNSPSPSITFVQAPSLVGDSLGILTLNFDTPTSILSFGVALSVFGDLTPGFTVELFDATLASLGVTSVNTSSLVDFSEGLFSYSGAPVTIAVVDFEDSAGLFAFDNLNFETETTPVPETTSTLGILAIGALGGSSLLKRKRQQIA